jgi:hypothetical protein
LIELILPICQEPCGGFVFHLSSATLKAVQTQGLGLFNDARQGRGFQDRGVRSYYEFSYERWQQTRLPDSWTRNGMWLGLRCMGWRFSSLAPFGAPLPSQSGEGGMGRQANPAPEKIEPGCGGALAEEVSSAYGSGIVSSVLNDRPRMS